VSVQRAVCIGAGGHAAVVIEALSLSKRVELVGVLDNDPAAVGKKLLGIDVLGGDDLLPRLKAEGISLAVMGIGSAASCSARSRAFERLSAAGFTLLDVIHPRAYLSPSASSGAGLVMLVDAVVNTNAQLGRNVLVNSRACIEHGCVIGDNAHIASGATLSGNVRVGARSHVGAGAVIRQGLCIGSDAVIGIGAVVIRDVDDGATVVGNPAARSTKAKPDDR
jgi:UDP-perosamine 4-acetyltransferase